MIPGFVQGNVAPLQAENERLRAENDRLSRLLDPRRWTLSQSDAWHRAIPDLQAAFDALREETLSHDDR